MAECAYCGDEIDGRPIVRNSKRYCTNECAELDEEEFDEEGLEEGEEELVDEEEE